MEGELLTAELLYVHTGDQSADMYTKSLTGPAFVEHHKRNLGEKRRSSTEVRERSQKKRRR